MCLSVLLLYVIHTQQLNVDDLVVHLQIVGDRDRTYDEIQSRVTFRLVFQLN